MLLLQWCGLGRELLRGIDQRVAGETQDGRTAAWRSGGDAADDFGRLGLGAASNWLRTLAGDAFASRKPAIRSVRPARVQVWATSIASATVMAVAAAG
jgi:hypothetical protein